MTERRRPATYGRLAATVAVDLAILAALIALVVGVWNLP